MRHLGLLQACMVISSLSVSAERGGDCVRRGSCAFVLLRTGSFPMAVKKSVVSFRERTILDRKFASICMTGSLGDHMVSVRSKAVDNAAFNTADRRIQDKVLGDVVCPPSGENDGKLAIGTHVAGIVEGVGPSVAKFKVGDKVIVAVPPGGAKSGSVIAVEEGLAVPLPTKWSFEQGAVMPSLALRFLQGLGEARMALDSLKGRRILVIGATGGVGSLALQALRGLGATVYATGDASSGATLRKLGAERVVSYKAENFWTALGGAEGLDLVVDALSSSAKAEEAIGVYTEGRGKVGYASVTHPAVQLVLSEGLFSGGLQLNRFFRSTDKACQWATSPAGMEAVGRVVEAAAGQGEAPGWGNGGYSPSEWMEAVSWPKDADSGARYGFPCKSLWKDEESDGSGAIDPYGAWSDTAEPASESDEASKDGGSGDGGVETAPGGMVELKSKADLDSLLSPLPDDGGARRSLVYVYAPTCRACKLMRPRVSRLISMHKNADFYSLNALAQKESADRLGVKELPAYVLVVNGEAEERWRGIMSTEDLSSLVGGTYNRPPPSQAP